MEQNKIDRINELARKAKNEGLNEQEKSEQNQLRLEYVKAYRETLREQLHSIKVVDQEGNDITPQKLKVAKNKDKKTPLN